MIPRPATRRVSDRRARSMGATAARARGAFPFPARPALPQGVATIPQRPAGRGILISDPATAQRETVAPASRRPAAWRGPSHCPVVATAGSVPAEQPKDEATRRIDGAVQVATETRSAARPTGRRIVAGETSRGGGECQAHPAEAPASVSHRSALEPFGGGVFRSVLARARARRAPAPDRQADRTDDTPERRRPF